MPSPHSYNLFQSHTFSKIKHSKIHSNMPIKNALFIFSMDKFQAQIVTACRTTFPFRLKLNRLQVVGVWSVQMECPIRMYIFLCTYAKYPTQCKLYVDPIDSSFPTFLQNDNLSTYRIRSTVYNLKEIFIAKLRIYVTFPYIYYICTKLVAQSEQKLTEQLFIHCTQVSQRQPHIWPKL